MVNLTKIYTRGGDNGQTSLGEGTRVNKDCLRIAAIGDVDEANAYIGVVKLTATPQVNELLSHIQNDLFDVGADLCMPEESAKPKKKQLKITSVQVEYLEVTLDRYNAELLPLTSFILPGGTITAAHLHVARTIIRRAERTIVRLAHQESVNEAVMRYINRLSDLLFVLCRYVNDKGQSDVLWKPGGNQ